MSDKMNFENILESVTQEDMVSLRSRIECLEKERSALVALERAFMISLGKKRPVGRPSSDENGIPYSFGMPRRREIVTKYITENGPTQLQALSEAIGIPVNGGKKSLTKVIESSDYLEMEGDIVKVKG